MRRCEISGCIHEGCHSHHILKQLHDVDPDEVME